MVDKRDISRKDFFNILMSGAGLLAAEKLVYLKSWNLGVWI